MQAYSAIIISVNFDINNFINIQTIA